MSFEWLLQLGARLLALPVFRWIRNRIILKKLGPDVDIRADGVYIGERKLRELEKKWQGQYESSLATEEGVPDKLSKGFKKFTVAGMPVIYVDVRTAPKLFPMRKPIP